MLNNFTLDDFKIIAMSLQNTVEINDILVKEIKSEKIIQKGVASGKCGFHTLRAFS